jgi:hypothetical protein
MPAPPEILELIERFDRNLRSYKKSPYNEAQACNIARRNPQVCPVGRLPAPVGLAERLVRGRRRGEAKGPDREGTKGAKECATARALRVLRDASRLRDPNTVALQRRIEVKDRQVDALHSAPQCRLGAGEEGRGGMLTPPKRLHQCNAPFVGWRSLATMTQARLASRAQLVLCLFCRPKVSSPRGSPHSVNGTNGTNGITARMTGPARLPAA